MGFLKDASQKAKEAAEGALIIDDSLAEAHSALGVVRDRFDYDWTGAKAEFERAIELKPNYSTSHQWYAIYFEFIGDSNRAIAESKRSLELDPASPVANWSLGLRLNNARRPNDAIEVFEKALELDQAFVAAHTGLGLAFEQLGQYQQAIAEFQKAINLSGRSPALLSALGHACALGENKNDAQNLLNELICSSKREYVSDYDIALVHTGLNQIDRAFDRLKKAQLEQDFRMVEISVAPRLDPLRSDSRFHELLRGMGLAL